MDIKIRQLIDSLIPRGGEKPDDIHVSFEDYLSRLSNFNRKLCGVNYRMQYWKTTCEEHKAEFNKQIKAKDFLGLSEKDRIKWETVSFSTRHIKLENEFEMLLYSFSSSLSALTRVVACFLKGSTQIHSHSKLAEILLKHQGFKKTHLIVTNAYSSWANELTVRRDASTHYISLSLTSSFVYSKIDLVTTEKNILQFGVAKKPVKYLSLWEDELPTFGGYSSKSLFGKEDGNKQEIHELLDLEGKLIVRRESPLPQKPELIDGEKYTKNVYKLFNEYVSDILLSLKQKLQKK